MKPKTIVQEGTDVLRKTAKPIPKTLFGSKELKDIVADMTDALDREADGVALAAPQIGISYRIFIIRYDRILPLPAKDMPPHPADIGIYINPEVKKTSRRKVKIDEGCLSVRGIYGKTKRAERATIEAFDQSGKKFERGGGGVLAQIFQHETDHLNGILFIDHASDMIEVKHHESPK